MRFNRSSYGRLFAPEDGGVGGSGGGAPPPPPDGGTPPAPPPPAPPISALAGGAPPPAPPNGAPPPPTPPAPDPVFGVIPEKFRVKNEAGEPDVAASWLKVEEHRANLERRMGSGDAPPKTATEYKLALPEAIATALGDEGQKALAESPAFIAFTEKLHGAGLSQTQYNAVMTEFLERGMELRQGMAGLDVQSCTTELQKDWKDTATYQANVDAAYRAAKTFGDVDKLMAKYGNDPDFIRVMAAVGAEVKEDTSASAGAGSGETPATKTEHDSLSAWLLSTPLTHPDWAAKNARYKQLGEKMWGTGPKQSGSMSFSTLP